MSAIKLRARRLVSRFVRSIETWYTFNPEKYELGINMDAQDEHGYFRPLKGDEGMSLLCFLWQISLSISHEEQAKKTPDSMK